MRIRLAGIVTLGLALALGGCGGSNEERQARDAIAASMLESDDDTFAVTEEQANCVGDGFVDRIGVDRLQEYGLLSEDLSSGEDVGDLSMAQEDADEAADVMLDCMDIRESIMSEFDAEIPAGNEETRQCVEESLSDDVLRSFLSAVISGNDTQAEQELMSGGLLTCILEGMSS